MSTLPLLRAPVRAAVTVLLLALAGLGAAPRALAQPTASPPERLTYQGFLADGNGNALATNAPKNYDVIFRLWDAQTGGAGGALWAEQQTVTVDKGSFSVLLGEGSAITSPAEPHNPLSTLFTSATASDRYVEMTVKGIGTAGADVTILPRLRLLTSPYAFLARSATKLVSTSGGDLVTTSGGTVTVNGTLSATTINAAGLTAVTDDKLSANVALRAGGNTFTGNQIVSSGNVGIGTSTPSERLTIAAVTGYDSGLKLTGSGASFGVGMSLENTSAGGHKYVLTSSSANADIGAGGFGILDQTAFDYRFVINAAGNVGIGTTAPANKLSVGGNADFSGNVGIGTTTPTRGKLEIIGGPNRTGVGTTYWAQYAVTAWINGADPGGITSIYADNRIVGLGLITFSDERIKRVAGHSDAARDLANLMGIEVTDYSYVDTLAKGTGKHKKVIAQQVERVYPQAVSKSTDVVPDIYKMAAINHGWVTLATNLKKGERVRLIAEKKEGIHEVLEVAEGRFRTDFMAEGDKVFVYGREVKDFRSVDYEEISMLNVSATQELARRLEKVEARESHVAELERKAGRVETLEQEVADLKKMVAQLAEASTGSRQAGVATAQDLPVAADVSLHGASAIARVETR